MGHRLQIFPSNFHGHDGLSSADGQFDGHLMRDLNASHGRLTDAPTASGPLVTRQSLSFPMQLCRFNLIMRPFE